MKEFQFKTFQDNKSCKSISSMQDCVAAIQKNPLTILYDSGKFFDQFGLYEQCQIDNLQYSLSLVFDKNTLVPAGPFIGLCLPKQCSHDNIKTVLDRILNQMSPNYVIGSVIDNPQQIVPEKHWLFYPVLIILLLLMILTCAATILNKIRRFQKAPSTALKFLGTFNLGETMKIFKHKHNVFNVFNGIKSICMFWVILGHEFSFRLKNVINLLDVPAQIETWFYLFVIGAFFAVDVFFFIGGFLVAYSFLREKSKNPLKYPIAIIHRVLRFWPSYIIAILIFYAVLLHLGSGPIWWESEAAGQINECARIWKPLFFVDNLVDNGEKMCMGWGWYLQNDMQIFILSMLYLFIYSKNRLAAKVLIVGTIVASLLLNFFQVQLHGYIQVTHLADFAKWGQYFPNIYIKPWTRCPPYLIGLYFGLDYMEYLANSKTIDKKHTSPQNGVGDAITNCQQKQHYCIRLKNQLTKSKGLLFLFQAGGVILMLFIILIPRTLQVGWTWPQFVHSLYLSTGKVFFVGGLYLAILPALLGVPSLAFFIMDTQFFNFVSKVSFWTYLIHYMIILQVTNRQKVDFYYSVGDILPLYIPIAALSVCFGFLGTIFVEVPFAKMEKMLMNRLMGKREERKIEKVTSLTQPLVQSVQSGSVLKNSTSEN